ncbi:MAG: hypothetical protein HUK22_01925, partial [Thermoguttaceae bacterium]|nr:hypothetical protein [Thermoguttaceae bacterium]
MRFTFRDKNVQKLIYRGLSVAVCFGALLGSAFFTPSDVVAQSVDPAKALALPEGFADDLA